MSCAVLLLSGCSRKVEIIEAEGHRFAILSREGDVHGICEVTDASLVRTNRFESFHAGYEMALTNGFGRAWEEGFKAGTNICIQGLKQVLEERNPK